MRFDSTTDQIRTQLHPFPRPQSTDTLLWYFDAPSTTIARHDRYRAYLVRVVERHDNVVRFDFLSVADGSDIPGGPHAVETSDRELLWPHLPSTFLAAVIGGDDCGFMMIDSWEMDKRAADGTRKTAGGASYAEFKTAADTSGGGTGKWPKAG